MKDWKKHNITTQSVATSKLGESVVMKEINSEPSVVQGKVRTSEPSVVQGKVRTSEPSVVQGKVRTSEPSVVQTKWDRRSVLSVQQTVGLLQDA